MCEYTKCNHCGSEDIRHWDDGSVKNDDGSVTEYCDVECQKCKRWIH